MVYGGLEDRGSLSSDHRQDKEVTSMDMMTTMQERRSVRSFTNRALELDIPELIAGMRSSRSFLPAIFTASIPMTYIPVQGRKTEEGVRLGTYGVIRGHQGMITGSCANSDEAVLQFGYEMEKIILQLCSLGIGSCWLGGTFNRKLYSSYLQVPETQIIPAVIPIGYAADASRALDTIMRRLAGSDRRLPLDALFFRGDFDHPIDASSAEEPWYRGLEMVRIAPSASNRQPWRAVVSAEGHQVHLYLHEHPKYNRALGYPIQLLDMGIAMTHLELAFQALSLPGSWHISDPRIDLPHDQLRYIASYTS
jgi:nitroreductase